MRNSAARSKADPPNVTVSAIFMGLEMSRADLIGNSQAGCAARIVGLYEGRGVGAGKCLANLVRTGR